MVKITEHMRNRNEAFRKLAASRNVRAGEFYLSDCRTLANTIFNALTSGSDPLEELSIDRVIIAGSVGKKTALGLKQNPDLDLVVFLNNQRPPFDKVLESIRSILQKKFGNDGFKCKNETRYSLQFEMDFNGGGGTIQIDLLPAVNYSQNRDDQCQTGRKEIVQDFSKVRYLSSSLAQEQVYFVVEQPDWIKDTIRIAKLWFKGCKTPISGGSCLMELITIFACLSIKQKWKKQPFYGFNRFLLCMKKLNELEIVIERFYEEAEIPSAVWDKAGPKIMDPSNPANNLAENLKDMTVRRLKKQANVFLRRINIPKYYSDFDLLFDFKSWAEKGGANTVGGA